MELVRWGYICGETLDYLTLHELTGRSAAAHFVAYHSQMVDTEDVSIN